jgi:ABC transport system ATP-binding/permease protein
MVRGVSAPCRGLSERFLFDESQARAPVRSLSGGEKARLLLARIMAQPANLLVLDEPTNDLDVETLDLLQDMLGEFDGTVLLVSHDRDFIDRIASTTLVFEGNGRVTPYAGGWSDYLAQRPAVEKPGAASVAAPAAAPKGKPKAGAKAGLSFTESHRLEKLPAEIARLEAEIAKLAELLSDANLFTREPVKFRKATEAMAARQTALEAAEEEWLLLAEKAEG